MKFKAGTPSYWFAMGKHEGERRGLLRAARDAERRIRATYPGGITRRALGLLADWCRAEAKKLAGK